VDIQGNEVRRGDCAINMMQPFQDLCKVLFFFPLVERHSHFPLQLLEESIIIVMHMGKEVIIFVI